MNKERFTSVLLGILVLAIFIPWQAIQADPPVNIFKRRYMFASLKWDTPSQVTAYKQLLNRTKAAGYNMLCVNNGGLFHIQHAKQSWFDNFEQVRAEAERIGLPLMVHHGVQRIPSYHDLNLAEAYPVRATPYQVSGGQGVLKSDHTVAFKNSGFEEWQGLKLSNWHVRILKPGINCVRDTQTKHSGNSSVKITSPDLGAHFSQNVPVKPFRAYRLSMWVKTENYSLHNHITFAARGNGRSILFMRHAGAFGWGSNAVAKTQAWKRSVIDFNSLSYTTVTIQARFAHMDGPGKGTLWVDDVNIEEVGLYEAVTRKSAPVKVVSAGTGKVYAPGKDYTLDIKAEVLYQGKLLIPAGSAITDGEQLKVDWFQLANTDHYHAPGAVTCIDEYYKTMEKDLMLIDKMFGGLKAVHVGAGEWREAFWDPQCIQMHKTPGMYMADFAQRTRDMFRKMNPEMQVDFKNDMFDPYHNATASFNSVNGDIAGSWHGITQDVFMWNWRPPRSSVANTGDPFYKSLMHFGGLDPAHPMKPVCQIIRIFGDGGAMNLDLRLAILDLAEKNGLRHVEGIMYNTWYNQYAALEKLPETCKKVGRWADNPYPGVWPELCPKGECDKTMPGIGKEHVCRAGVRMQSRVSPEGKLRISYSLQSPGRISLQVVNARGQVIHKFAGTHLQAGQHEKTWNAKNMPAGVYFVRLHSENNKASHTLSRKLALLN